MTSSNQSVTAILMTNLITFTHLMEGRGGIDISGEGRRLGYRCWWGRGVRNISVKRGVRYIVCFLGLRSLCGGEGARNIVVWEKGPMDLSFSGEVGTSSFSGGELGLLRSS